jgi:hypothetical protein
MKPNFILGIGSQRAGSTLICRLLEKHSQIRMNPVKELHYFDTLLKIRKQNALTDFSLRQLDREVKRLVTGPDKELVSRNWRWYILTTCYIRSQWKIYHIGTYSLKNLPMPHFVANPLLNIC